MQENNGIKCKKIMVLNAGLKYIKLYFVLNSKQMQI